MALVGYARVSTLDQNTRLQLDALRRAGVSRVYQDKASGVGSRPQLHRALASLRRGDEFVVWKLDRIGRGLFDLLAIIDKVKLAGAHIRSLTEPIDTASPYGRFTLQVLGAVAELERNMIRERVRAGQRAARERGQVLGRPRAFDDDGERLVAEMYRAGVASVDQLAEIFGVKRGAVRGPLCRAGLLMPGYSGRAR
ncbi:MAG: recombinase family protein [Proteobacteria bacterium]|nr:recombinase family protein [Pseudomonadota bacterium]